MREVNGRQQMGPETAVVPLSIKVLIQIQFLLWVVQAWPVQFMVSLLDEMGHKIPHHLTMG